MMPKEALMGTYTMNPKTFLYTVNYSISRRSILKSKFYWQLNAIVLKL